MARQQRMQYEGAWYHVMNRGAGQKYILQQQHNKETFLELLNEIHIKYGIEFHAYCLMDNHYHLLLRTPHSNIAIGMKYLQSMFTRIYNKKINSDGPIFRSRYKSILIESTNSILQVCRYIHLNPLEANITSSLYYKWSSYEYYISANKSQPRWLYLNFILNNISNSKCVTQFINFHNDKISDEIKYFYYKNNSNYFCIVNDNELSICLEEVNTLKNRAPLIEIEQQIKNYFGVSTKSIRNSITGTSSVGRITFILISFYVYQYSINEITIHLKLKYASTISKLIKTYGKILTAVEISYLKKHLNDYEKIIKFLNTKIHIESLL